MKSSVILLTGLLCGCSTTTLMTTPMTATLTGDGKYWVLHQPLEYRDPATGMVVTAPRGFATDLASVPRMFWTVFPPCGQYTPAAVIHDYLYWTQPENCNKECADSILLNAMSDANVSEKTRKSIYYAVKYAGQKSWDDNAKAKRNHAIRFVPEEYMNFGSYDTWQQIEERIRIGKTVEAIRPAISEKSPDNTITASVILPPATPVNETCTHTGVSI
ncbi:hypothetical protein D3C85_570190 [compost metagenome]